MSTVPKALEAQFKTDFEAIPSLAKVKVIATEKVIDAPRTPTLLIRQTSIGRCPTAPLSHRNVGIIATLISPHEDMDRAGEQLADLVADLLDYLDTRFAHDDATQVGYNDRLAYDLPLTVIAAKDK
ncbi:hypothetical protein ACIGEP_15535 [Microbacterium sp. NPDC077663]|uniref:hypothetical protein n=1 Tax=Microbacterium sp. NPDC077663 TaxID=3364189 RepID=UPI0037C5EB14